MKTDKRYWRVKYGYNVTDIISIEETELEKAIYAQVKGKPVQLNNTFVNGKNIISITPNFHKHTGWYDYYEPKDGEDWVQIQRDCPSYDGVLGKYKERVSYLIYSNRENEIGKNVSIPEIDNRKEEKIEYSDEVKQLADYFKAK